LDSICLGNRLEKVKDLLLVISVLPFHLSVCVLASSRVIKAKFQPIFCILHYKGLYPTFEGTLKFNEKLRLSLKSLSIP